MKRTDRKPADPLRVAWGLYCRGACDSTRDLARKAGVSYPTLLRVMKRDSWELERERGRVSDQLERQERLLPWARKQATLAARRVIEVCRTKTLDLRTLHYEVKEAAAALRVDITAARLAELRQAQEAIKAGRMPDPRGWDLFPNDPRWERPGSWYNPIDFYHRGAQELPPLGQRPGKAGQGAEKGAGISARRIKRYLAARAKREGKRSTSHGASGRVAGWRGGQGSRKSRRSGGGA